MRVKRPLNPLSHKTGEQLIERRSRQLGTDQEGLMKEHDGLDTIADDTKVHE